MMVRYQREFTLCGECSDISSDLSDLTDDIVECLWEDLQVPSFMGVCDHCGQDYICTTWTAELLTEEEN